MIANRFDEFKIPIDALRILINRSLILPVIILINGHGQIGKSTFLYHLANRILQIKKGIPKADIKWNEWDYKTYCTTSAKQFVDIYDKSDNQIIALEEAGEQLNYYEWYSVMNQVFSSISRTQGYKRNICILITPHANDLQKHQQRRINFILWVKNKWELSRKARIVPRVLRINYLTLESKNFKYGYIKNWDVIYSATEIAMANLYTEWLKQFKGDIMEGIKEKVGLIPRTFINKSKNPDYLEEMLKM